MSGPDFRAIDLSGMGAPHWVEYRIGFCGVTAFARLASGPLPPLMAELCQQGQVLRSFFVRKEPGLRLRLLWATAPPFDPVLAVLQVMATVDPHAFLPPVQMPPYRESALFGGEAALAQIEAFFDADSAMVLALVAGEMRGDDPAAISVALIDTLFRATAMDGWERWSLWRDLADLRGGPAPAPIAPQPLKAHGPALRRAISGAETCGARLQALAASGQMTAHLRAVVPIIAAYHLNRMGFAADTQAALATGAARAIDPHGLGPTRCVLASVAFERVALGPASVFDLPDLDACVAQGDTAVWRDGATQAEMDLLGQAVLGPMRFSLQCRSPRPLTEALAVLDRPPSTHRKHDRRTIDTVLNLTWRHCANPVPFANLAATLIFDPAYPLHTAHIARPSCPNTSNPNTLPPAPADPFATDRYDPRAAAPLPAGMDLALATAAAAFSLADAPTPAPQQMALAALLDRIGNGNPIRLDDADARLSALALDLCLPASLRDPVGLGLALGLPAPAPWPELPGNAAEGPLTLIPPDAPHTDPLDRPRRVALRLQPGAEGVRLAFFGADRMCWLARYVPRAHPMEQPLRRAAADWLAGWPETVDATTGFSRHPLDAHAALTLHGALLHPQRHWLRRADNGLYGLTDVDGRPVHAVHFGVSAPASMAPVAQLALLAGARWPSWGEWVLGALNRSILRHILLAGAAPFAAHGIRLGANLLLPGCACMLPAGAAAIGQAAAGDPTALWDILREFGGDSLLGPVVVRSLPGGQSRILDIRLPAGLRTLGRMARQGGATWLLIDKLSRNADGTLSPDLYIELCAAYDGPLPRRTPTWTSQPPLTSLD